jgi:plasmid stabilization system protein ParE
MSVELLFAEEVQADLDEAYLWYEGRRRGLGEEFLGCVDATIQQILRLPRAPGVIYGSYRRILTRRFPYAVYYEFEGERVTNYGVLHTARDPAKWRERLGGP